MFDNPVGWRGFLGGTAAMVAMTTLAARINRVASSDTLFIRPPGDIANGETRLELLRKF